MFSEPTLSRMRARQEANMHGTFVIKKSANIVNDEGGIEDGDVVVSTTKARISPLSATSEQVASSESDVNKWIVSIPAGTDIGSETYGTYTENRAGMSFTKNLNVEYIKQNFTNEIVRHVVCREV